MILTEVLQPACVKVPLKAKDKESAIIELVDLLDANGQLLDKKAASEAVFMREQTRSTGIGSGIAIPHGKCKGVKELVMAVGVAGKPIDFESIDGKPVTIIILLVSPVDQTGPHIQALARISRLMLDTQFRQSVEKADSGEQVYELFSKKETSE
jgi:fructose-specific phosphotransferase system IIA component